MDARELDEALSNLDRRTSRIEQILPTLGVDDEGEPAAPEADAALASLRDELRRVSEGLDAVDRRDAAQHGGLKGEIAHVIRRIVRLEAMPGLRQSR